MTVSVSPDISWESDSLGENAPILDDGYTDTIDEPPSTDATRLLNVSVNACPTCGEPIERPPGTKGRSPKYHPDCRPSAQRRGSSNGPRAVRVAKGEQLAAEQTEQILEQIRRRLMKATLMLAIVEPYDAMVIRINTPELLDNLRPALLRYERFRIFMLGAEGGASVLGLVLTIATTLLPIAAHHGLIPAKKVAQILLQIPLFMHSMQQKISQGSDDEVTDDIVRRAQEQSRLQREARMRAATAEESVGASIQ